MKSALMVPEVLGLCGGKIADTGNCCLVRLEAEIVPGHKDKHLCTIDTHETHTVGSLKLVQMTRS